jgi:cbb3-type cytochrome oxidase maturation protein
MNIIPLLIICSLSLGVLFLLAFVWWVKSGQGEDLVTPGMRMLFDDQPLQNDTDTTLNNNEKQTTTHE